MIAQFDEIQTHVDHMVALIDDLVLINRAHSDQHIFQVEPTNVEAYFKKLIDQIVQRRGRNHIVLTCTGQIDNVLLDQRLVRYVASNLISNAQKYSAEGSEIRVGVQISESALTLSVSDDGIGIPQSELSQIFNPFFRASNSGGTSGMGLGLALVKSTLESRGGSITVSSVPDEGTTFVVSLPLVADKASLT
jgi:signal transduction histidine kinase